MTATVSFEDIKRLRKLQRLMDRRGLTDAEQAEFDRLTKAKAEATVITISR